MNTSEFLKAARLKITDPKNWTTGNLARNSQGKSVDPASNNACCWCAYGAISCFGKDTVSVSDALDVLAKAGLKLFGSEHISTINDEKGHQAILQIYDEAIRSLETPTTST